MSTHLFTRHACLLVILSAALLLSFASDSPSAHAAIFVVSSTTDAVDANAGDGACATSAGECTLRAAVQETNALPGADAINVPSGTYVLTVNGFNEEQGAQGDLDITDDVIMAGSGDGNTIVTENAFNLERIFDVRPTATVAISGFSIRDVFQPFPFAPADEMCGGGILNNGDLTLTDTALIHNVFRHFGGGVCNRGTLTARGITIRDNQAAFAGSGGGIYNSGIASVTNGTISGNHTDVFDGGGIYNSGTLVLTNVTISGNSTTAPFGSRKGGGLWNQGTLTATNVTISGNSTDGTDSGLGTLESRGAGLGNRGTANLQNVTIANNTSGTTAGGVFREAGTLRLANVLVAHNVGGDCEGTVISEGHNLSSDATCGFAGLGDLPNTGPLLDLLADNGGPTQTHALLAGSPAIDSGDNGACPATDQRGELRPSDGNTDGVAVCDIGSYEAPGTLVCTADLDKDGSVDNGDVRIVARSMQSQPGSKRWNTTADVNRDLSVDVNDLRIVVRAMVSRSCL